MPRAVVTNELCDTIKALRSQNKIYSKDLAAYIRKSPAYISKLENGDIQTIDLSELSSILHFITREESDTKSAEQIYESLKLKYSQAEIDAQLWFKNFDTINRQLPIPSSLVDFLNDTIKELGVSRSYLNKRINSNESLDTTSPEYASMPENIWYDSHNNDLLKSSIKISLSQSLMDNILDKSTTTSSYMFVFCIAFYLLKIQTHAETVSITNSEYKQLYSKTTELLNEHKFYSISERNTILGKEVHNINRKIESLLNSFSQENANYIWQILSNFMVASDYNIELTNQQLQIFTDNLDWDLGFMLRIISLDFNKLNETSISNRKALISEIEQILNKYKELPSINNKIETY